MSTLPSVAVVVGSHCAFLAEVVGSLGEVVENQCLLLAKVVGSHFVFFSEVVEHSCHFG